MNKDLIEEKGLPYLENSTMIPTDKNCSYPDKKYIFDLLTSNFLFATLATTAYDSDFFNFIYRNLNTMYQYESRFSDNDKVLLEKLLKDDHSVDKSKISWTYECCFIWAWIINLVDFPSQEKENNVDILNDQLFIQKDEIAQKNLPSKFYLSLYDKENKRLDYERINLRSFDEILEKADLMKRYLWGLEELRIKNQNNSSGLNETIIRYQVNAFSKALNWDLTNPGI